MKKMTNILFSLAMLLGLSTSVSFVNENTHHVAEAATVTSTLTADDIIPANKNASTYVNINYTDANNAITFKGNAAKSAKTGGAIQLRSGESNSGIVVAENTRGHLAKKVTLVWATNTTSGRKVDVYGKNSAYTSSDANDLYNSTNASLQGTKIGSIICGTSTELTITESYEYIGLRSNNGALYLSSISIDWDVVKDTYELTTRDESYSFLYDGATHSPNYTLADSTGTEATDVVETYYVKGSTDDLASAPTNPGQYTLKLTKDATDTHSAINESIDFEIRDAVVRKLSYSYSITKTGSEGGVYDGSTSTSVADDLVGKEFYVSSTVGEKTYYAAKTVTNNRIDSTTNELEAETFTVEKNAENYYLKALTLNKYIGVKDATDLLLTDTPTTDKVDNAVLISYDARNACVKFASTSTTNTRIFAFNSQNNFNKFGSYDKKGVTVEFTGNGTTTYSCAADQGFKMLVGVEVNSDTLLDAATTDAITITNGANSVSRNVLDLFDANSFEENVQTNTTIVYVILNLGDLVSSDVASRANSEFQVSATINGVAYNKSFSVASLVEDYYNNDATKAQVEDLYSYYSSLGFYNA